VILSTEYSQSKTNTSQLDISLKTLTVNFLRIPATALESLGQLGVKRFLDVMDWSQNASRPTGASNAKVLENVGEPEGTGKSPEDEHSSKQDQSNKGGQGS
jgi:hypothetical protein